MPRREDHGRHRERSPDWERKSREQRPVRSREREGNDRPEWKRDERKVYQGALKVQSKERNSHEVIAKVNRKEVCPFLVRVFYSINHENVFGNDSKLPENQLNLHLWYFISNSGKILHFARLGSS